MKQNFILLSLIFGCVMCSCTSYKLYDDDLKKNIHRIGESGWYAWSLNVKQYLAEQNGQDFNREDFELLPENRSRIINDIAQSDVTGAIVGIIGVGVAALIGIGTGQVLLASIAARYILYAAFSASASGALQYLLFN